ncbi:MAG: SPFH/Band 7/PHB domain protein [Synechococcales cyanobacterium CRU_2_2]|nr:SPFH/Band 7/PHB domain protein [Synechococcales cyanobacterium CRU_2_2]
MAGSIKIVNEGEAALVERFGRYQRTLSPGLNFTLPVIDTVIIDTTREQVFDVPPQDAVTKDVVQVKADAVVFWEIDDLYKVHYQVDDIKTAIESFVLTSLRTAISQMDMTELLSARSDLSSTLLQDINSVTDEWGVRIRRVDVKDLKFDEDVMQSLEDLRISREHKLAAIVQAEGRKQVAIEEAESRRAAAIAEAQGLMEAVKILSHNSEVESEKKTALQDIIKFLVAQRYVDASQKIGESPNAKILFMDPNKLSEALGELIAHEEIGSLPGSGRTSA